MTEAADDELGRAEEQGDPRDGRGEVDDPGGRGGK